MITLIEKFNYDKTYWSSNGKYQSFYDNSIKPNINNKQALIDIGIPARLAGSLQTWGHKYYRWHNDGDYPTGLKTNITKSMVSYNYKKKEPTLYDTNCDKLSDDLEQKMDELFKQAKLYV